MAEHVAQRREPVLHVVIHLAREITDRDPAFHVSDARFDGLADAGREPAGQEERGQRGNQHGGGEPQVDVALQSCQQSGGARHHDPRLLDPPRPVDRIHVGQRRRWADDDLAGIGVGCVVRQ